MLYDVIYNLKILWWGWDFRSKTIYNRNEIRPRNRNPINNLIYTISNYFEEINLIIKTTVSDKEENFMIKGVWGGKTVEEWSNKMVIFNKISV